MQYDEDSNGTLDLDEIHHGIQRLGFDISQKTAQEVMKLIDVDGNNKLTFAEFRCAILSQRISHEFEDISRRTHNDCKLQDEYRERCLVEPISASAIGPASVPSPSSGYMHHNGILEKQKESLLPLLSSKDVAIKDLEVRRIEQLAELEKEQRRASKGDEKNNFARKLMKQQVMKANESRFAHLREAFSKIDKDGSGSLDAEEMKLICKSLQLPESWTDGLIADADLDGDGEISFIEFVDALERISANTDALAEEQHVKDCLTFEHEPEPNHKNEGLLLASALGNFEYRDGPPVPKALPKAGGWDNQSRKNHSKEPLLFSAHASHFNATSSNVLPDGVTTVCTRRLSYTVKACDSNFLK